MTRTMTGGAFLLGLMLGTGGCGPKVEPPPTGQLSLPQPPSPAGAGGGKAPAKTKTSKDIPGGGTAGTAE